MDTFHVKHKKQFATTTYIYGILCRNMAVLYWDQFIFSFLVITIERLCQTTSKAWKIYTAPES